MTAWVRVQSEGPGWLLGFCPEQLEEWGYFEMMWGRAGGLCTLPAKWGLLSQMVWLQKVRAEETLGSQGSLRTS